MSPATISLFRVTRPRAAQRLLVLALVALSCAFMAEQAVARPDPDSVRVSGTYAVYDLGTTDCAPVGASAILLRCATNGLRSAYSGDLVGDATANFVQVINCRTGRTAGHGTETFTGSIDGVGQGSVTWTIFFTAAFNCTTEFPSGLRAIGLIRSGSGDLREIGGRLQFGDVTYQGVLRLDDD